ncbi:hypothetical protein HOY80DRAFT_511757 [Tuber brumale]|nr:hypothetical protein HOY80DRAFT_511757 [Tuber brumale]
MPDMLKVCSACSHLFLYRFSVPAIYSPFACLRFAVHYSIVRNSPLCSPVYYSIVHLLPSVIHKDGHVTYRLPLSHCPFLLSLLLDFRRMRFTVRFVHCWLVRGWFVVGRGHSWSFVRKSGTMPAVGTETGTGMGVPGNWKGMRAAWQLESL